MDHQRQSNSEENTNRILKKEKKILVTADSKKEGTRRHYFVIYANGGQWLDALLCITRTGSTTVI